VLYQSDNLHYIRRRVKSQEMGNQPAEFSQKGNLDQDLLDMTPQDVKGTKSFGLMKRSLKTISTVIVCIKNVQILCVFKSGCDCFLMVRSFMKTDLKIYYLIISESDVDTDIIHLRAARISNSH
jgi:hypothetical protein